MTLHAVDDVGDAIDATRAYLFPVDRSRWLRLAVVTFFVAGGFGLNGPTNAGSSVSSSGGGVSELPDVIPGDVLAILGLIAAVVVALLVVLGVIGSIMEFVFVESLRSDSVRIRQYGRRYLGAGLRLFAFRLAVFLLAAGLVAGVVYAAGPTGPVLTWTEAQILSAVLLALPLIVVLFPLVALIDGFTVEFVVPVVVLQDRSILGGWRRFWSTLRRNLWQYAAYVLVAFLLNIVVGLAAATVIGIAAVALAIPFLVVGATAFFVGGGAFTTAVIAVLAVLLVVYVVLVLAVVGLVQVPLQTFLRYYTLLILGDTDDGLDPIPDQRTAVRE
ncbi:DUF7544 domain-containing protein [Halorientalis pallida]|uniref:Membrane domain of glycerophosphoryl diester phosphodiesterase n=1 Tax=Halorientalis pallida TaxID=2479928 RepID=A0A498KZK2_9EURY|nr:hypothetical protein [Halorientalis pallida]RXK50013.1 hypothetical protein EAF64_05445 [Halorientalis pallida]